MKLLLNDTWGGYGVSNETIELWFSKKGLPMRKEIDEYGDPRYYYEDIIVYSIERDDPTLIEIFEEIGSKRTSGEHAKLKLVELPDFCKYTIGEYDGTEWVAETWIEVSLTDLANGLSKEQLEMAKQVSSIKIAQ